MGFFLRKSINLGPIRLNLSKSGLGVSTGVKGLRVSTGPAGNRIHIGRGGLYFRSKLPGTPLPMKLVGRSQLSSIELPARPFRAYHPRIEEIIHEIHTLDSHRLELLREIRHAKRRSRFYHRSWLAFKSGLRHPRLHMSQGTWKLALLIIVPMLFAATALILGTIGRSITDISWISIAGSWLAALFAIAFLSFVPTNERLLQAQLAADECTESNQRIIEDVERQLERLEFNMSLLIQERQSIEKTIEYRRSAIEDGANAILRCNWQTAQGYEFEEFLERVFVNLGLPVSRTGKTGDQGVDLIVTSQNGSVAIQAKGGVSTIGNGAVQEALAGMIYYSCDRCVVVTNSRFTTSAEELAEKANCCLIDGERLESLALGWHPWFEPRMDSA